MVMMTGMRVDMIIVYGSVKIIGRVVLMIIDTVVGRMLNMEVVIGIVMDIARIMND